MPLAFQARAFTDLPDVERIEVLRGPQSTLYGKSASAGLINIITRGPTDTLQASVNAMGTTDDEYGGSFSVSGPISPELGYIVSAAYSQWDGNVKNLFTGDDVNGREAFNTRAKLKWESDDGCIADTVGQLSGWRDHGGPSVHQPRSHGAAARHGGADDHGGLSRRHARLATTGISATTSTRVPATRATAARCAVSSA